MYAYGILFMIVGAATSFMDLLTFPLVTLGIPLVIWIALQYVRKEEQSSKTSHMRRIWQMIHLSAFWTIGYGGFWALKWIIGNIVTGRNIVGRAFEQVELRAGGLRATTEVSFGSTMKHVIWDVNHYFVIFFAIFVAFAIFSAVFFWKNIFRTKWLWEYAIPLCIVSVYPLVWYRVVYQHTYCHYWFTYREMAITVFSISMLLGTISLKKSNWRQK